MNGFQITLSMFIFSMLIFTCSSYDESDVKELRLIIIGKTGVGKSATGNSILGEQVFVSETSAQSITRTVAIGSVPRFGRKLVVVDTPGLCDTTLTDGETLGEVIKTLMITSPGPHAFILVIRPGRFTKEDEYTVSIFRKIFGPNFHKYLIILFTDKDRLEKNGITIQKYVDTLGENSLKDLIKESNNRFLTMDYSMHLQKQEEDVKLLLSMIDELIRDNPKPYYETKYSDATEKIFDDIILDFEKKKYIHMN